VARAHQIAAQVLARAHQVLERLLLDARHDNALKLTGHQQSHQSLGIAAIDLHPIRRAARDQPRRAHQTLDPRRLHPSDQHEPGRPPPHTSRAPAPANPR
jgi:hypothetical protein